MHLISKVVGKCQIPLQERPLGFRRISAAWSQFRPSQRGPNPPPMGSDALSLGLWPAYFIFAALEQVLQQQQSPSLSWGTLETFCPFHRSENTFSSKKRDWFGTKTAAPHPSNNSLKLHPILHLPLCPGFIAVKVVKSAAGCPVICRIFQMKN